MSTAWDESTQDSQSDFFIDVPLSMGRQIKKKMVPLLVSGMFFLGFTVSMIALLVIRSSKGFSNPIVLPLFIFTEVIFVSVAVSIMRKKWKASGNDLVVEESSSQIRVAQGQLSLPSFLARGGRTKKALPRGYTAYLFQISDIVDFEVVPGAKNSPPHFKVTVRDLKEGEKIYYFINRFSSNQVKGLYRAMHLESGLGDAQSPFGAKAEEMRAKKSKAVVVTMFTAIFGFAGFFILQLMIPPVHHYSAVLTLLFYGAAAAFPISLLLKGSLLAPYFKKGFGTEIPFWLLVGASLSIGAVVLTLLNGMGVTHSSRLYTIIIEKKRQRHKNSTSYYLYFDVPISGNFYLYPFGESSSVKVSESVFNQVQVKQSEISMTLHKGRLGFPLLGDFQLNSPRAASSQSIKKSSRRVKGLLRWKAELPQFGDPDDYNVVRYADGRLRSREPVVKGELHGVGVYYHPNGQLYGKISWVRGKKQGTHKLYRDDGSLDQNLSYKNGELHGLNLWYDEQGKLKTRAVFDRGKQVQ